MTALEIRSEMLELIRKEDDRSLKELYNLFHAYKKQKALDQKISEGEEDIKNGDLFSPSEVQKMIKEWVQ